MAAPATYDHFTGKPIMPWELDEYNDFLESYAEARAEDERASFDYGDYYCPADYERFVYGE